MSSDNLTAALAHHAIDLPEGQAERLDRYARLLWKQNENLNLTRHTDYEKFVTRDLVDSLAFSRFLGVGERVLDVGAGGGVPGVVLAILRDDLHVELCESVGKKARALTEIVAALGIAAPVHHARAEELLNTTRYQTLVVRAVARLRKLLEWFAPHWDHFERILVLKGPGWAEERGEARHHGLMHDLELRKLASYPLPGTQAESVLLQLHKVRPG